MMTSILGSGSSVPASPFGRVQNTLKRDVNAGAISATDGTALATAISDISSQLQAGGATAAAAAGTSTAAGSTAPASMKDRVDGMINNEVSSGKLTSDQASELKQVFAQAHVHMHGAHGHGGHDGGAIAALTGSSSDGTDAVTGSSAASAATTGPVSALETAATSAVSAVSALEAFLTQFKAAISSNSTYGAGGSSGTPASLLINAIG